MFWRLFGITGTLTAFSLAVMTYLLAEHAPLSAMVLGAIVLTCGLATLGLTLWRARRITDALAELQRGAESLAAGSYGIKVYDHSPYAGSQPVRSFNQMSEHLAQQITLLEEDRQQLRMILSGMIEGVIALDADQHILFANERGMQLLGLPPQQTAGRKLWEVVRRRALQDVVQRALAGPEPHHEELVWNSPQTKSLTVYAARMPGAPPRGAILVINDISELRRLERLRSEFVANVSHELKTPLSVIKACIETLMDGAIDDLEHRGPFLSRIAEQTERLHALILDLLSLARLESGAETFTLEAVPLPPIVEACLARHRARAAGKNQTLEDGGEEADVVAWGDQEAIHQILDNLIDNAVKYTPEGGRIRVRYFLEPDHVCLEVSDNGIGIPEQDLQRIFERFYRVDKARSRELGGTGLGLSIVKHLVQALQGSIQAQSQIGKGTTFLVRLPRAPD
jgi:two-component system phosphate regulon sensor histidine kinase PhoR